MKDLWHMGGKIVLSLSVVLLMASCVRSGDVRLIDVSNIDMSNPAKPDLVLDIENRSGCNIHILSGSLAVENGGAKLLDVKIADKVVIPRKSEGDVTIPLRLQLRNPLIAAIIMGGGDIADMDLTVSGTVEAKAGIGRKKVTFEQMALREFITKFGIDMDRLGL